MEGTESLPPGIEGRGRAPASPSPQRGVTPAKSGSEFHSQFTQHLWLEESSGARAWWRGMVKGRVREARDGWRTGP